MDVRNFSGVQAARARKIEYLQEITEERGYQPLVVESNVQTGEFKIQPPRPPDGAQSWMTLSEQELQQYHENFQTAQEATTSTIPAAPSELDKEPNVQTDEFGGKSVVRDSWPVLGSACSRKGKTPEEIYKQELEEEGIRVCREWESSPYPYFDCRGDCRVYLREPSGSGCDLTEEEAQKQSARLAQKHHRRESGSDHVDPQRKRHVCL